MNLPYAEVIGDPVVQSKSPAIHGFWLEALGISARYQRRHVLAGDLADYLDARRDDADWRGCNVTMPHKQAVLALLDRIDPQAQRIGAVNTIVREPDGKLGGYNTDAPGFIEPLMGKSIQTATVIGAGGAARAVLVALRDIGVRHVSLQNRSRDKALALLDELAMAGDVRELGARVPPADLLVNTSALGMAGQPPLPPLLDDVADHGTVYDIVTTPLETELLREARARRLAIVDGLAMLIGQADHAFARFFGQKPPRDADSRLRQRILAGTLA